MTCKLCLYTPCTASAVTALIPAPLLGYSLAGKSSSLTEASGNDVSLQYTSMSDEYASTVLQDHSLNDQ